MREITKLMVSDFALKKLGYDFAGFKFNRTNELSFHHMIIPHRDSKAYGIGEGYVYWNGAILVQSTSHEYLHLIESIERPMFLAITAELIKENKQGYVDLDNIRRIHEIITDFESKHYNDRGKKGKRLIKREYFNRINTYGGK